jgi:hypothetical protein
MPYMLPDFSATYEFYLSLRFSEESFYDSHYIDYGYHQLHDKQAGLFP